MKNIKILQTSDVHSYIFSQNEEDDRGLLRFKDYINKLREDNHIILIDTGDMFQGTNSFLSYYVAQNIEEYEYHPIVDVLNDFKYNIFTPGNHEFNYGIEYLQKSLNKFEGDIIVANILGLEKYLNIKPYKIIELENIKVGIIGFTTAQVKQFEKEENIKGLEFISINDAYTKYEKELKSKCDVIVVNYHGGIEYDLDTLNHAEEKITKENESGRLIKTFDSIDVVLSGHQHREISTPIKNVYITQPSVDAARLSEITISENDNKYKKSLAKEIEKMGENKTIYITGKLVGANELKEVNKNLETSKEQLYPLSLLNLQKKLETFLEEPISKSDGSLKIDDLFFARKNSHLFVDFLNEFQIRLTNADISAVNLFDTAIGFSKEITINEALKNYPFPNTLQVLEITKEDLKKALEISASYFEIEDGELIVSQKFLYPKKLHFQYDMYYGIYYEMDITKPVGERITKLEFKNKVDESKIKIALNSYRATNYAWFDMYENKTKIYESQLTISEMLINYLKNTPNIEVEKIETFKVIY